MSGSDHGLRTFEGEVCGACDGRIESKYLEAAGYDTQVLEFIDMEHTPKNILLRAVRADEKRVTKKSAGTAIEKCERFLQIEPTLGRLLADKGENYKE